jgi:hypothetical protein
VSDAGPSLSPSSAPENSTIEPVEDNSAGRDPKTGRFLAGNPGPITHGASRALRLGEPPDPQRHDEIVAALVRDCGGEAKLTSLERAQLEHLAHLLNVAQMLASDHARRGMLTPRGRLRPTFNAYLQVVDRIDRMVQRLVLRGNAAPETPLSDYLSSHTKFHSSQTPGKGAI